jgi:hypothetical protein
MSEAISGNLVQGPGCRFAHPGYRANLCEGQELSITELAGGGFQAMPYDPDFEKTLELADQTMDKYRDTLAALAK